SSTSSTGSCAPRQASRCAVRSTATAWRSGVPMPNGWGRFATRWGSSQNRKRAPVVPAPSFFRALARGLKSIAVMIGLEGPFDRHADIVSLLLRELAQLDPELFEVERRHLLVEMLGQNI